MLSGFLPYHAGISWTPEFGAAFKESFRAAETAVPRDGLWFFLYPFVLVAAMALSDRARWFEHLKWPLMFAVRGDPDDQLSVGHG